MVNPLFDIACLNNSSSVLLLYGSSFFTWCFSYQTYVCKLNWKSNKLERGNSGYSTIEYLSPVCCCYFLCLFLCLISDQKVEFVFLNNVMYLVHFIHCLHCMHWSQRTLRIKIWFLKKIIKKELIKLNKRYVF